MLRLFVSITMHSFVILKKLSVMGRAFFFCSNALQPKFQNLFAFMSWLWPWHEMRYSMVNMIKLMKKIKQNRPTNICNSTSESKTICPQIAIPNWFTKNQLQSTICDQKSQIKLFKQHQCTLHQFAFKQLNQWWINKQKKLHKRSWYQKWLETVK